MLEKRAKVNTLPGVLQTDQKGGERGWWGGQSNESGRERRGDERAEGWKKGHVEVEGKQELRLRG